MPMFKPKVTELVTNIPIPSMGLAEKTCFFSKLFCNYLISCVLGLQLINWSYSYEATIEKLLVYILGNCGSHMSVRNRGGFIISTDQRAKSSPEKHHL